MAIKVIERYKIEKNNIINRTFWPVLIINQLNKKVLPETILEIIKGIRIETSIGGGKNCKREIHSILGVLFPPKILQYINFTAACENQHTGHVLTVLTVKVTQLPLSCEPR